MSVRVKRYSKTAQRENNPMGENTTQDQRETTYEGYTFHWGVNEVRNFLDDGVGLGHTGFAQGGATIIADNLPFGTSES